ncbi:hypothetical protein Vretifemale_10229, partial [Volvox reticuliferus]
MGSPEFQNLLGGPVHPMSSPEPLADSDPVHLGHAPGGLSMQDAANGCGGSTDGGGGGGAFGGVAAGSGHAAHSREMLPEVGATVRNSFASEGLITEMLPPPPPQPTKSGEGPSSAAAAAAATATTAGPVQDVSPAAHHDAEMARGDIHITSGDAAASGAVRSANALRPNHNPLSVAPPQSQSQSPPPPPPPSTSPLIFQAAATCYMHPYQAASHHLLTTGVTPPVSGGNPHLPHAIAHNLADRNLHHLHNHHLHHHHGLHLQQYVDGTSSARAAAATPPSTNMQPSSVAPTCRPPSLPSAPNPSPPLSLPPGPGTVQWQHRGDGCNPAGGSLQMQTLYDMVVYDTHGAGNPASCCTVDRRESAGSTLTSNAGLRATGGSDGGNGGGGAVFGFDPQRQQISSPQRHLGTHSPGDDYSNLLPVQSPPPGGQQVGDPNETYANVRQSVSIFKPDQQHPV